MVLIHLHQPQRKLSDQRGFTLVEVLASFVILSIIFLGALEMQWKLLSQTESLYFYNQALQYLQNAAEIEKTNSAPHALANLKQMIQTHLPDGELQANTSAEMTEIKILWKEKKWSESSTSPEVQLWVAGG